MTDKVLILGGYGNFGLRIARSLSRSGVKVILAGRNEHKLSSAAATVGAEAVKWEIGADLAAILKSAAPRVVINTCGPFQNQDYALPETCAINGVHYIDLADGRDYVCNISQLETLARDCGTFIISGASTVPGLSSAVIESILPQFSQIDSLEFGITPGQRTQRGVATAKSILTYLGKPLRPSSDGIRRYGWQDIYRQPYPGLGKRWMANCDVPDLDLLPEKYGIRSVHFSAGLEVGALHLSMWAISWLMRIGLPLKLEKHADSLLRLSNIFNIFGSEDGGMHMVFRGLSKDGRPQTKSWFIIAKNGDGPQIPCVPAIVLTKKLLANQLQLSGAYPCLGLVSLEEYMQELAGLQVEQISY